MSKASEQSGPNIVVEKPEVLQYARACSGTVIGVEAHEIAVESNPVNGLPGTAVVGLARGAVKEALVRIRSAFGAADIRRRLPKIIINLLPAELPKAESGLDLPMALALLASYDELSPKALEGRRFIGELALSGEVEPVRGAILIAELARKNGDRELILPSANAEEAALIPGLRVIGVRTLQEVLLHLNGEAPLTPAVKRIAPAQLSPLCLSEVRGQDRAKRALELAATGGHNLLMIGPPGSGKTMLARRLPTLLPPLETDQCIEVTRIHSAAGQLREHTLISDSPFRSPHHTASEPALCGGGSIPRPGEITLAHRGVLFLDELPEFSRRALESLREPLEEGKIHIARAALSVQFPAEFLLVAAMNPCPCGRFLLDRSRPTSSGSAAPCLCSFDQVLRYRSRISGPLLDRIDMHVFVDSVPYRDFARQGSGETSETIRARVVTAQRRQSVRLGPGNLNARMSHKNCQQHVPIDEAGMAMLEAAIDQHGLSTRAITRIRKVARTIADLAGDNDVTTAHLEEAIGFRLLDRGPLASGAA